MADILLRGLEVDTIERLKERARRNERSFQAELRVILREAAASREPISFEDAVQFARKMQRKYAGKITDDSTDIVRRMRDAR